MEIHRMMGIKKQPLWPEQQPLLVAGAIYLALGYALYFAALSVEPPVLVLGWIEDMKPFVKGLRTASRVAVLRNETAFPAQIVILYCAFGTILLAAWAVWYSTAVQFRARAITAFAAGGYSRFRYALSGVMFLAIPALFMLLLFSVDAKVISWRDHVIYSSSLQSASFLLISTAMVGLLVSFVIPSIEYALKGQRTSKLNGPAKPGLPH